MRRREPSGALGLGFRGWCEVYSLGFSFSLLSEYVLWNHKTKPEEGKRRSRWKSPWSLSFFFFFLCVCVCVFVFFAVAGIHGY